MFLKILYNPSKILIGGMHSRGNTNVFDISGSLQSRSQEHFTHARRDHVLYAVQPNGRKFPVVLIKINEIGTLSPQYVVREILYDGELGETYILNLRDLQQLSFEEYSNLVKVTHENKIAADAASAGAASAGAASAAGAGAASAGAASAGAASAGASASTFSAMDIDSPDASGAGRSRQAAIDCDSDDDCVVTAVVTPAARAAAAKRAAVDLSVSDISSDLAIALQLQEEEDYSSDSSDTDWAAQIAASTPPASAGAAAGSAAGAAGSAAGAAPATNTSGEATCPICQENFSDTPEMQVTKHNKDLGGCGAHFHVKCLEAFFESTNEAFFDADGDLVWVDGWKCPTCNEPLRHGLSNTKATFY